MAAEDRHDLGPDIRPQPVPRRDQLPQSQIDKAFRIAEPMRYPGTNLRLVYEIAGQAATADLAPNQNSGDQEV